jgi:hypothetical protein
MPIVPTEVAMRVECLVHDGASLDEAQTKIHVLPEEILVLRTDGNDGHVPSLRLTSMS